MTTTIRDFEWVIRREVSTTVGAESGWLQIFNVAFLFLLTEGNRDAQSW